MGFIEFQKVILGLFSGCTRFSKVGITKFAGGNAEMEAKY